MSSTSSSAPTSTQTFAGGNGNGQNQGGGVNSSLYLFTFLITVLVLAVISSGLLFRAYYIRRRFQLRVEEAIRLNQPLPADAARALGLIRPGGANGKKDKKLGPMPGMWEAEMLIDRTAGEVERGYVGREEMQDRAMRKWDDFTPVAVLHHPTNSTPDPITPEYIIPPPRRRRFMPSWVPVAHPLPRAVVEPEQTPATIPRSGPKYTIPPPGEDVTVGVLIALPFEEKVDDLWVRGEEEEEGEKEVPHVMLGVVGVKVE